MICIGLALFDRIAKIRQKLREAEQTCDILFLVLLKSLKQKFDVTVDRKIGTREIDLLLEELDLIDKKKVSKSERKKKNREKRTSMSEKEERNSEDREVLKNENANVLLLLKGLKENNFDVIMDRKNGSNDLNSLDLTNKKKETKKEKKKKYKEKEQCTRYSEAKSVMNKEDQKEEGNVEQANVDIDSTKDIGQNLKEYITDNKEVESNEFQNEISIVKDATENETQDSFQSDFQESCLTFKPLSWETVSKQGTKKRGKCVQKSNNLLDIKCEMEDCKSDHEDGSVRELEKEPVPLGNSWVKSLDSKNRVESRERKFSGLLDLECDKDIDLDHHSYNYYHCYYFYYNQLASKTSVSDC